jgi:CheY-like chemotaxis protein/two-component sensor histidine kinase
MLAHELRNPLAPIRTSVEVLRHGGVSGPIADQVLSTMERQLAVLVRLVDDLLDVSRIMQGKVQLRREATCLKTVLRQAMEISRPHIDAKRHQLRLSVPSEPLPVEVDPVRLAQVISNLLNNAAKYTPDGGRIEVEAGIDGDRVRLAVRDTGIGIPADRLPYVFDLFTQVDSSLERAQGGLGIGLTLVKRLVEMHGGEATASSAGINRGSEFVVTLPIYEHPVENDETRQAATSGKPTAPFKILVVDDNVDAASILGILLRIQGHEVTTVHSGLAALDAMHGGWDIVFLDIGLPDMNGCEVAREIRRRFPKDGATRGPALIAVTGYGREEDRRRSEEAGFDYHFTKPLDPELLASALRDIRGR